MRNYDVILLQYLYRGGIVIILIESQFT